jgi:hypothetical protein
MSFLLEDRRLKMEQIKLAKAQRYALVDLWKEEIP